MASPKTDVTQAVGRILREKHSQPVVVDIIDSHDMFQKQWIKRKKFYKSQNYKIIECSNKNYSPNTDQWTTVFGPKQSINNTNTNNKNISDEDKKTDLPLGKCFIKIKK